MIMTLFIIYFILSQVFINFAKEQHAEDRTVMKRKCLCFKCC